MSEIETEQIGSLLRERRLELKLSLKDVAEQTRIRKTYIEALESGRFEDLPGQVYVIGFLQNYARALGMSADALLEAMPAKENKGEAAYMARTPVAPVVPKQPRLFSRRLLLLLLGGVLLLSAVWLVPRWFVKTPQRVDQPPVKVVEEPVVAAAAEEPVTEPVALAPDVDAPVEEAPAEVTPQLPAEGGTLKVVVDGRGQFWIAVDGGHRREYVAKPGLALSWRVRQSADLELRVDGDVRLLIDGQEYTVHGNRHLQLTAAAREKD